MLSDNGRVLSDKGRVLSDKGLVLDANKAQDGHVLSDNGIWLIGKEEAGEGRSWGEAKEGREDIQSFLPGHFIPGIRSYSS